MKKVSIEQKKYILDDFFKIEEAYLRFEQFSGEMSRRVRRLKLERGDSVAILVYNETIEKIILVSQFRYPTYQNGHGWIIETIAGMVDRGELPEQSARREIEEETGLIIKTFEHISTFYLSPGGSSERIFLYYSEVSGEQAKYKETGGLLHEDEDIKSNGALHGRGNDKNTIRGDHGCQDHRRNLLAGNPADEEIIRSMSLGTASQPDDTAVEETPANAGVSSSSFPVCQIKLLAEYFGPRIPGRRPRAIRGRGG